MVGESLEQHCEIEFNKLRSTGFKGSYFEKIMKLSQEAKEITSLKILTLMGMNISQLCLR